MSPQPNSNFVSDANDAAGFKNCAKLTLTFLDPMFPHRNTVCVVAVTDENIARLKARQVAEDMINAIMDMVAGKDAKAAAAGMSIVSVRREG